MQTSNDDKETRGLRRSNLSLIMGYTEDDLQKKPRIAMINTWNEGNVAHIDLRHLAEFIRAGTLIMMVGVVSAQTYPIPGRPITTIVPSTAGGGTDTSARLIAPFLEKELGVPIEVVNKPGASQQIGNTAAANAKPDGHTLVWMALPTAAAIYLDTDRKALFKRDSLAPVSLFYSSPLSVVVLASSPHKTLKDLVDAAKANPGKLKSGTMGFMTVGHFANIAFQKGVGVRMATVNFQGGGPQATALLGGHIDVAFSSIGEMLTHRKSGAVRVLAVMDSKRSELAPDVPTAAEAGFEVESIVTAVGLAAPAVTPKPIIDRLNQAMQKVTKDENLQKRELELGNTLSYLGPQDYGKFWDDVDIRYKPLIEAAKELSK